MVFLLCCCHELSAQDSVDSLKAAIEDTPTDSTAKQLYIQLLRQLLMESRLPEMQQVAEEMQDVYTGRKDNDGIQNALFYLSIAHTFQGHIDEAMAISEQGYEFCVGMKDTLNAANHLANKGMIFQRQGEKGQALEVYLQVYKWYNQYDEKGKISKILNNIAAIYRGQENYDKAIEMYKASLKIKADLGDSTGMAASYMNLGLLYSYKDEMENALDNLGTAQTIYKAMGQPADAAYCEQMLGVIYFNFNYFAEAKEVLKRIELNTYIQEDPWLYTSTLFSLGSIALIDESFAEAERYLQGAIQLSKETSRIGDQHDIYLKLSQAQHAQGKDRAAFQSLQTAYALQDSIKEDKRLALEEEMQAKFDVLQKEKALALNQLELEQRTKQRNKLIVGLGLLLLLAGVLFAFFRQRIRIARQQSALQQQRIKQLEQEKKLAALSAVIEGEEKERLRIAADLHDGLGGLLTSVKAHFYQLLKNTSKEGLYEKTSALIDEACTEVRRISHNMAPRSLALSGLASALADLCASIQNDSIQCELDIIGLEEDALADQAVGIYRIVQELCHNALKHAAADHLFIQVLQKEPWLSILVEDNGKGFDVQAAMAKKGLGLASVSSRVDALNGEIHWDSVLGEGTNVSIRIPLDS
jgi:two-component system NarL family sensor kinase